MGNADTISFGPFTLDLRREVLTRDGEQLPVGHRALVLLQALLGADGETVTKEWPMTYWTLVPALAHLGRIDEAKATLAMAIAPGTTLAGISAGSQPERFVRFAEGFAMVGLTA